jgi:tetratricopeptide (TPR) repeat protein
MRRQVEGESWLLTNGRIVAIDDVEALAAALPEIEPDPRKHVGLLLGFTRECFAYRRFDGAAGLLAKALALAPDGEMRASGWLEIGRAHEGKPDFRAAADAYRQGLAFPPQRNETWYFLNNNLAFCLNQLGSFEEAEVCCRTAIAFQPYMYNAHKNLGVSLAGQGRLVEAANSLLEAARRSSGDPRALGHLEDLLAHHPEVGRDHPEILAAAQECCMDGGGQGGGRTM